MSSVSYAQAAALAAKSQPPVQAATVPSTSSQALPISSNISREAAVTNGTVSVTPSKSSNGVDASGTNGAAQDVQIKGESSAKPQSESKAVPEFKAEPEIKANSETKAQPEIKAEVNGESGAPSAPVEEPAHKVPVTGTEVALPLPKDHKKQATETAAQGNDRPSKGPNAMVRGLRNDTPDARKNRKGKKSRDIDQDSELEPVEKEGEPEKTKLQDAPLPSKNPWMVKSGGAPAASVVSRPPTVVNGSSVAVPTPNVATTWSKRGSVDAGAPTSSGTGASLRQTHDTATVSESKTDGDSRRGAQRGSRSGDTTAPLVTDASLWPTPDTAVTGSKSQDKPEKRAEKNKEESRDQTAHKKTTWKPVPHVPTVVFETVIPPRPSTTRGGRTGGTRGAPETGGRGGRGGRHTTTESVDKAQAGTYAKSSSGSRAHERTSSISPHSDPHWPADGSASREPRRSYAGNGMGGFKSVAESPTTNGSRDQFGRGGQDAHEAVLQLQASAGAGPYHNPNYKGFDPSRDAAYQGRESNHHRGDGSHRARGGRRGGANNQAQQTYSSYGPNGHAYGARANSQPHVAGPFSPVSYGGGSWAGQGAGQGSRNAGRAHSVSSHYRSSQGNGGSRGARMPMLQTAITPPYDTSMQGQVPFASPVQFLDPQGNPVRSLAEIAQGQIEYYLSVDNLLKDMFLRRHMDSKGFVFLELIAGFKRIQDITTDQNIIIAACEASTKIDLVRGTGDDRYRLRPSQNWQQWVLPKQQRLEPAQNDDGPDQFTLCQPSHQAGYMHPHAMSAAYVAQSPVSFTPNGVAGPFMPFANGVAYGQSMQGGSNGFHNANGHVTPGESQLSATVPEFSPSAPAVTWEHQIPAQNTEKSVTDEGLVQSTDGAAEVSNRTHGEASKVDADEQHTNGTGGVVEAGLA